MTGVLIAAVVLAALVAIFALQNSSVIMVTFLARHWSTIFVQIFREQVRDAWFPDEEQKL